MVVPDTPCRRGDVPQFLVNACALHVCHETTLQPLNTINTAGVTSHSSDDRTQLPIV